MKKGNGFAALSEVTSDRSIQDPCKRPHMLLPDASRVNIVKLVSLGLYIFFLIEKIGEKKGKMKGVNG